MIQKMLRVLQKNSHVEQASNCANPHFKVVFWKGLCVVFSEGRGAFNPFQLQLWSCHVPWLFFEDFLYHHSTTSVVECCDTKNLPGLKRRALSQSLPALLFRTLRTLADSRKKDAKYHGSNLNYKLDKKNDGICVAGAALWDACCSFVWQALGFGSMMVVLRGPAMQLTCNTHATHSQHNTQHEHFSCKFSIKVRVVCQNLTFAFKDRILGQSKSARSLRIYRKSARVACCVDCVLRVCCMWVAWQGHATQPSYFQSPAPATQKSGMRPKVLHLPHKYHRFFYPICNSDCCHDILHPFSYCQPMSWAYEKVVLAETVTMPFVSVREDFLYHNIQQLRPCRTKLLNDDTNKSPGFKPWHDKLPVAPSNPHFKVATEKGCRTSNLNGCHSEGRRRQPVQKQLWSWGARGIPRLNLLF